MNICIFGVGGVGGYFGGCLARKFSPDGSRGVNIYFIARGKHLEEIKRNGLVLNTPGEKGIICRPAGSSDTLKDFPSMDMFILCVKGYDLTDALNAIKPAVGRKTVVLPIMNGADIFERTRAILDAGIVLPACAYVATHLEKPGTVTVTSVSARLIFGRDPGSYDFVPNELFDIFTEAGINYEWVDNPFRAIWEKYIFIASFALVTAGYNRTMGEVLDSPELKEKLGSIMGEIAGIARHKGIVLPDDIAKATIEKAGKFPFETKTSFQRDVEQRGKKNEADLYGGTILRFGRETGTATPVSEAVYGEVIKRF